MAKIILYCLEPFDHFQRRILVLEEGVPVRIGRKHSSQSSTDHNALFVAAIPLISYKHAFITYKAGKIYIQDSSKNGTFLNGCRLRRDEEYSVISGDIIQLGRETSNSKVLGEGIALDFKLKDDRDFNFLNLLLEEYKFPMQLYRQPPTFEQNLELFYQCIRERLEVLQILDSYGKFDFLNEKLVYQFLQVLNEKSLSNFYRLIIGTSESFEEEYNLQKMDHVSHYLICLACCRNFIMRKWFIEQESKLLYIRWHCLTFTDKKEFVLDIFPEYEITSAIEKKYLFDTLDEPDNNQLDYYKIPFYEASPLLKHRNFLLRNGTCYVPLDKVITAVQTSFSSYINQNFKMMKKNLHKIWFDERIESLIKYIEKTVRCERFIFSKKGSTLMLEEIKKMASQSFPLCMNYLYYYLKKNHHLKNGGRFQFGLFLKGIGLSLNDSLTFWRYFFTKKMSIIEFMKNYNYHILHSYGAAGKMADYPPLSCKRILQAVPSYNEYNGCPFKILDEENLAVVLKRTGIHVEGVNEVCNLSQTGTPQLACNKYFEIKHGISLKETVFHPNNYFDESRKAFMTKKTSNNEAPLGQSSFKDCSNKQENDVCHCDNSLYEW